MLKSTTLANSDFGLPWCLVHHSILSKGQEKPFMKTRNYKVKIGF